MSQELVCKNLLISYEIFNLQASESSVIFLHGWRSNKEVWAPIINQVCKDTRIQVYTIDLPGFGTSQAASNPFGVGDYADVVDEFIKKLNLKNTIIVGHSFGGRVGIKLAAEHPEIISKLVLVDSAGFAMSQDKKSAMNFAAKMVKPIFKPKFMQGLRKQIYKTIGAEDYVATPELQQTFVKVTAEDLTKDMEKISCPTLIINGENDVDTPVEFGKSMQSLIHNSKFIILPNAGHFSFLDQSDEFIKNLNQFLQHG